MESPKRASEAETLSTSIPSPTMYRNNNDNNNPDQMHVSPPPPSGHHTWRFWCIFVSLCLVAFISSIDATIVTTALPTITREVRGESQYVWIANSFVVASTAPQPLFAQLSNIFGRRNPMIFSLVLFALGSGLAGGASNVAMLIAGRSVQGVGTGGVYVLLDVILCDMVPLRSRAKYLGIMLSTAAVGTTLGPLVGGSLAEADWRWIFYLNLPFAGIALVSVVLCLNVNYRRSPTWKHALLRVDFVGNLIFIPSVISVLLGLVLGGVQHPWDSWRTILPLVLGFVGWAAFHVHQFFAPEPSVPPRLFANRTSAIGYILTFFAYILLQMIAYFMPVYFQGVLGDSPFRAGVDFLPFTVAVVPFGIVAGVVIEKTGRYKPIHWTSFVFTAIGMGLLSILDENSSTAAWAGFQIVAAIGCGLVLSSILPAVLAALPESDVATATGAFSFIRQFGSIWGVTMPSIIFNGEFDRYASRIDDTAVREQLSGGRAYAFASGGYTNGLQETTRQQVRGVYVEALQTIWQTGIAFALFSFFLVFLEKHIELRKTLDTEYGLKETKSVTDQEMELDSSLIPGKVDQHRGRNN